MIKLIASDLDGTIIDKNNAICEENINAIQDISSKKIPFVICTGKTYPIIKSTCNKINANYGIFGNGNQIVNLQTGEELYRKLLTTTNMETCYKIAKDYKMHIHVYTDTEVITEELMYLDLRNFRLKESNYYETSLNFKVVKNLLEYVEEHNCPVFKLVISSTNSVSGIENEIKNLTDLMVYKIIKRGKYQDKVINKEYEYLDIMPCGISKKHALDVLKNYLEIESKEVMAIGDNCNDLEMVKSFGVGVAIADAYDELKQIAKYTTINTAENGGFAEAVYKFIKF